ncbi:hypothetical protein vBAmePPT11V19_00084 [Alteromonas phage vB_AmeP_PT11-V19]|nr:hypothetical protein vBAmePPT11V19_00084 [Alteromonas phage vB_AmeP_PT11-V19]
MEKKPEALQAAFLDAKRKLEKIKQLGITPDMEEDDVDALVEDLSTAKALKEHSENGDGPTVADLRNGQQWYVESLIEFSGMSAQEQIDSCYEQKFAEQASEMEMIAALEAMTA